MEVIMKRELLRQIEVHLEGAYPNEGAGFLLGQIADDTFIVGDVLPLANQWDSAGQHNRFQLLPEDALQAELAAQRRGLDVIGVFHSHPDHPAQPSQWDLAWATWPNFAYLITRVAEGRAQQTRAWRLAEDRESFEEDQINLYPVATHGGA